MFFARDIFTQAGLSVDLAAVMTVLVFAFGTMAIGSGIFTLDRFGRRPILLGSSIVLLPIYVLIIVGIAYNSQRWGIIVACVCVVVYFAIYCMGVGTLSMVISVEIFEQKYRAIGMSIATIVNWSLRIVVGMSFEPIFRRINQYAFLPFAIIMALFVVYAYVYIPETAGRDLEDIAREIEGREGWSLNKNNNISRPGIEASSEASEAGDDLESGRNGKTVVDLQETCEVNDVVCGQIYALGRF